MRDRTTKIITEHNKMDSATTECALFKVAFTDGTVKRICNNTASITFQGEVYAPGMFSGSLIRATRRGEMPVLSIVMDDIEQVIAGYVRRLRGASGSIVDIYGVDTVDLTAADVEATYEIVNTAINDRARTVTFNLGGPNYLDTPFILQRYIANRCTYRYFRHVECAYEDPSASRVLIGSQAYICTMPHTATAVNHPSTGASVYRRLLSWRKVTANGLETTWTADTLYTAGDATCNRSIEQCRLYGVSNRFGGFKGLNASPVQTS
jgi:phage-related protein